MKSIFALPFLFLISLSSYAEVLSYSGRLVNATGIPVTGSPNLKFDLVYSGDTTTVICTKTVATPLSNGVFHVNLDFTTANCGTKTLVEVLGAIPASESLMYQVTDMTNSRAYGFQPLSTVPMSIMSQMAKTIADHGAAEGQVLKWNATTKKWVPGVASTATGTLVDLTAGAGITVASVDSDTYSVAITNGGVGTTQLADSAVTSTKIADGSIVDADIANTTISYGKLNLANGSIPSAKVSGLDTSLSGKEPVITPGTTAQYWRGDKSWQDFNTAARAAVSGTAPLSYNSATGAFGLGVVPIANGGTGRNTSILNSVVVTDVAGNYQFHSCPDGQVIVFNGGAPGCLLPSTTDNTKLPLAGGTMLGNIDMGGYKIDNLPTPTTGQEAATKSYVDNAITGYAGAWDVNGGNVYRSSGNVGIGTANPGAMLDVGENANPGSLRITHSSSGNTPSILKLVNGHNPNGSGAQIDFNSNFTTTDVSIRGFAPGVASINTAGSERLRITETGSVGIGTTTPNGKLDVKGSIVLSGSTSGYVGFQAPATAGPFIWTLPATDGTSGQVLRTDGAGVLSWVNANSSSITALTGDVTASGSGSVAATISVDAVNSAKIADGSIVNADIANSTITYGKLDLADGSIPAAKVSGLDTAARTALSGTTPINYVSSTGVISLDTVPVSKGGTGLTSSTSDSLVITGSTGNYQFLNCSSGEVVTFSGAGPVCAPLADSSKLPLAGGTMTGQIDMNSYKIVGLATPTSGQDAATKSYVDSVTGAINSNDKLPLAGGTMTGAIAMGTNKITGLGDPTVAQDAATKNYVDAGDATRLPLAGGAMTGAIAMGTNKITGLGDPTAAQDAATKNYVDSALAGAGTPTTTDNLTEGSTNLYFKDDRARASLTGTAPINYNSTTGVIALDTVSIAKGGTGLTTSAANSVMTTTATGAYQNTVCADGEIIQFDTALGVKCGTLPNGVDSTKLPLAGGTMTGAIAMGTNKITGLGAPTADTDATTKLYVDTAVGAINSNDKLPLAGGTMTGAILMGSNLISGLANPVSAQDAATKNYVDTAIAGAGTPTTTDDLPEGSTNLYFNDARARASLSGTAPIDYNSTTGVIALNTVPVSKGGTGLTTTSANTIMTTDSTGAFSLLNCTPGKYVTFDAALGVICTDLPATADSSDKLPLAGGTMTGAIAMGTNKITGLGTPTADTDATTKLYVDTAVGAINSNDKLPLAGGTMTGAIAMGTSKITGLGDPTAAQDAATKNYVDTAIAGAGVASDTDSLPEGSTNLYFSDTRARASLSGTAPINYNSTTGVIALDTVSIAKGGTGLTTSTANAVMTTDATGAYQNTVCTDGQILQFDAALGVKCAALPSGVDNTKLPLAGGTMTGAIAMGSNAITGLADPTAAQDAATKNYVDTAIAGAGTPSTTDDLTEGTTNLYFNDARARASLSGTAPIDYDSATGVIALDTVPVSKGGTGLTTTSANTIMTTDSTGAFSLLNCTPGKYVTFDAALGVICTDLPATADSSDKLPLAGGTMTGAIAMGTNKITGLGDPTLAQDAATKNYVDSAISAGGAWSVNNGNVYRTTGNVGVGIATPTYPLDVVIPNGQYMAARFKGSSWNDSLVQIEAGANPGKVGVTYVVPSTTEFMTFLDPSTNKFYWNPGSNMNSPSPNAMVMDVPTGNMGVGTASPNGKFDVKGSIVMSGATSGFSGFRVPAAAGSTIWQLPAADGSSGQVLSTNGSGVLSWTTAASGGTGDFKADGSVPMTGNLKLNRFITGGNSTNVIDTGLSAGNNFDIRSSDSDIRLRAINNNNLIFITSAQERMRVNMSGNVGIGTSSPNGKLDVNGTLVMTGSVSGFSGFQAAATAGSTVWTLPAADGTSGQVLSTNGAGVLSWTTASAGGITALTGDVTASGSGSVAATIANNAITSAKIADSTIVGADIAAGTIPYAKLTLTDGEIPFAKLASLGNNGIITTSASGVYQNTTCSTGEILQFDLILGWQCSALSTSDSTKLPLAGGTMTGAIAMGTNKITGLGDPTDAQDAATKNYVDSVVVGATPWTTSGSDIYRSSGNVGIGTSTPTNNLEVRSSTNARFLVSNTTPTGNPSSQIKLANYRGNYGDGNPSIVSFVARGTSTSPSSVTSGMTVLSLQGRGYAESGFGADRDGASIDFVAASNWGNSNVQTDMIFKTAGSGSWSPIERMRISANGNVGVGTSNPGAKLHVNGASAFENNAASSAGPTFSFWKSRNYAATQNGDELGFISFYGHSGSGLYRSAYILGKGEGTPTATSVPGQLSFYTTPAGSSDSTERMTITSEGYVGIGVNNPTSPLVVKNPVSGSNAMRVLNATGGKLWTLWESGGGNGEFHLWKSDGTRAVQIGTSNDTFFNGGNVGIGTSSPGEKLDVLGNVKATAFVSTSDRRLKKKIKIAKGLPAILQLRGVTYEWREDGSMDMGVIAQEVEEVFPWAVVTDKVTGYKAVKYNALIGPLIEASKELAKENQDLKRRVASLEAENEGLNKKLDSILRRLEALEKK